MTVLLGLLNRFESLQVLDVNSLFARSEAVEVGKRHCSSRRSRMPILPSSKSSTSYSAGRNTHPSQRGRKETPEGKETLGGQHQAWRGREWSAAPHRI